MYYDLNIPYASMDRLHSDKLKLILFRLSQNHESTVALNQIVDSHKEKRPFELSINTNNPVNLKSRITVDIEDTLDTEVLSQLKSQYDLVAIRTNNYTIFHEDINRALKRNIYFEICYADAIKDDQCRIHTMQIAKCIFELTKGDHVIMSSQAESVSEIRNPFDIYYLAKSFGLPNDKAKHTIQNNCEQLLQR
ncbi:Polymerase/histidinol phosphatase-like protein [Pilobolus umbonatus]|nr:Polymerase/histidinol phosphatase-like protein [Pilobolus umbonatus]